MLIRKIRDERKKRRNSVRNSNLRKTRGRNNQKKRRTDARKSKGNERKVKTIGKKRTLKKEKTMDTDTKSLTDQNVRDYKFAVNQKRKALRIQKWIKVLDKKVNNSMTYFEDGALFFSGCSEGLSIYETLR